MNLPLILRQLLTFQRGRRSRIVHCFLPALLQENNRVRIAIGHRARYATHRDGMKFVVQGATIVAMSGIADPMAHDHQDARACMVGAVPVQLPDVGIYVARIARIEVP